MEKKELPINIKKNLLDLKHQKFLQYYTITLIIIFTYIIGIVVAFLTKQIDYKNINQIIIVVFIFILIISIISSFSLKFKYRLDNLLNEIKKLK